MPASRPVDRPSNNLPLQLTSFVGRAREIAAITAQLTRCRLVTLTGAGGCGKTRLAIQVAADLIESFGDGVWFVDLAPLSEESVVPQAILASLGVPEAPARPVMDTLTEFLRGRTTLLVLDNCEHLVDACARLVDALLHACPRLTILATSRELLGVPGETAWRVPSLSLPDRLPDPPGDAAHVEPPTDVEQYEAVRLFVERVRLVQPGFQATAANAPSLIEVCRRLDGLPLALELAAARARVLSVEEIAARLNDRFRLLTGGSRTALRRHQTLRTLIDWSHDLLGAPERVLLRRLAVFAGGWTLAAAEAVCADPVAGGTPAAEGGPRRAGAHTAAGGPMPAVAQLDVLDLLTELVDKSLVVGAAQDGETRFRLLETVRQYAEEQLLAAGEAAAVRGRHAEEYTALAEQAQPHLLGRDSGRWHSRLRREHDNLRAALQWAEATENATLGLRAAVALHVFWQARHRAEGRAWLRRLLALPGAAVLPATRSRALSIDSILAALQLDRAAAQASADEALRLAQQAGGPAELAAALWALGYVAWYAAGAHAEGARLFAQSQCQAHEAGDQPWEVLAMNYRARALDDAGEHAAAVRLAEETLARSRGMGHLLTTAWMLQLLARDALALGDRRRARTLNLEALAVSRQADANTGTFAVQIGAALLALAELDYAEGDSAAGRARCRESLLLYHNVGERPGVATSLQGLGVAAAAEGQWERALRLAGGAGVLDASIRAAVGSSGPHRLHFLEQPTRAVDTARRELGEPAATAAWQAGAAMTYDQAIAYALEDEGAAPAATLATPPPSDAAAAGRDPVATPSPARAPVVAAALLVDALTHEVRVGAAPLRVRLSALEFQLLAYLFDQQPRVCTRRELGDALWGAHAWDVNLLHGLVRRLKDKLEPDPAHPRYVITVPQVGYRLIAAPADEAAPATA